MSGIYQIQDEMCKFKKGGGIIEGIVGIDHKGTSVQALIELNKICNKLWIFHIPGYMTFHPKLYVFTKKDNSSHLMIGSNNLTLGGLFRNSEMALQIDLDLNNETDKRIFLEIENSFLRLSVDSGGSGCLCTEQLIDQLFEKGYLLDESEPADAKPTVTTSNKGDSSKTPELPFPKVPIPSPPKSPIRMTRTKESGKTKIDAIKSIPTPTIPVTSNRGFVMTLKKTDVGMGQTTKGAQRRSPEVFIPLAARDADTIFWQWDSGFKEDVKKRGIFRRKIAILISSNKVSATLMTWPEKHDFRFRTEEIRKAAQIDDILKVEISDIPGIDYEVEIINPSDPAYPRFLTVCSNPVRHSQKSWGYYL